MFALGLLAQFCQGGELWGRFGRWSNWQKRFLKAHELGVSALGSAYGQGLAFFSKGVLASGICSSYLFRILHLYTLGYILFPQCHWQHTWVHQREHVGSWTMSTSGSHDYSESCCFSLCPSRETQAFICECHDKHKGVFITILVAWESQSIFLGRWACDQTPLWYVCSIHSVHHKVV